MKAVLLLLTLSLRAFCATCPTHQPKDEVTLTHLELAWAQADEHHDKAPLKCMLADEFEEITEKGQVISRSQMLAESKDRDQIQIELSEMRAHIHGNFAWVRGVSSVRVKNQVPTSNRFTDIFIYREGRWQCVAGHESRSAR